MKTKLKIIAFYSLTIMLAGCVPSLHPLFTENELIFDANLAGIWTTDSNETWKFKSANKGYECIYIDKDGKIGKFNGGLGKLKDDMFLDIYPAELNLTENDFYKAHFVPAHTFMRVHLAKDSLKLRAMNPDSFDKLLKSDPNVVRYEQPQGSSTVLTASTKELQDFMLKYGIDEKYGLFGKAEDADKLQRVNPRKSNEPKNKEPNQP